MLLYTSGATSGSPRGVTLSHSILGKQVHIVQSLLISIIFFCSLIFTCKTSNLQIERVVDAWDWTSDDSVLHCIGLGSTYGLINSLQVIFHCVEDGFKVLSFVICILFHLQAPLSMGAKITLMPQFDPLKVNVCKKKIQ